MEFKVEIEKMENSIVQLQILHKNLLRVEQKLDTQVRTMLRNPTASGLLLVKSVIDERKRVEEYADKIRQMHDAMENIASAYRLTDQTNLREFLNKEKEIYESGQMYCVDRLHASDEEKRKYIEYYERLHPEEAERFRNFLRSGDPNNLTEEEIQTIKYLVYTSPAPFGMIYLRNIGKFDIGSTNTDGAYYSPGSRTVNYDSDSFENDPRGPYTTFFHETGHGIDDRANLTNEGGADTENFTVYSDKLNKKITLREAIEYDVYYNKDNPHSMTSIAERIKSEGGSGKNGNTDNVIRALKNGSPDGLSKEDRKLYNAVKNDFNKNVPNTEAYEAVSDVYGGMSGNELRNGYGHDKDYWNDPNSAGSELWAEYFSYNMAGDEENLNNLNNYFPEASKVLEQYAYSLAG